MLRLRWHCRRCDWLRRSSQQRQGVKSHHARLLLSRYQANTAPVHIFSCWFGARLLFELLCQPSSLVKGTKTRPLRHGASRSMRTWYLNGAGSLPADTHARIAKLETWKLWCVEIHVLVSCNSKILRPLVYTPLRLHPQLVRMKIIFCCSRRQWIEIEKINLTARDRFSKKVFGDNLVIFLNNL